MNKYLLLLSLLCNFTAIPQAQTDTVSSKISKVPFKRVDAIATFPQGDFKAYITRGLQINHTVEYSVKGQIILLMGIGADGSVAYVSVLKSLSPQIDPEVVRVVKASPKWKPAMLNGQTTSMDMVLNIDIAVNGIKPLIVKASKPSPVIALSKPVITPAPAVKNAEPPIIKPPVIVKKAEPVAIKKPAIITKAELPVVKKVPPVIAKKIDPPVVKKPAPVIAKVTPPVVAKPVPPIVKKPEPPAVKKSAPVIAKVTPPLVAKPVPPGAKKPEPPIVKKPAPVIAKVTSPVVAKPAPVIAKAPPPVVKKPAPVIAKAISPIAKKPTPVIAKKVEPPVAKKPVTLPPAKAEVAQVTPPPVKKKRVVIKQSLFNPSENNAHFPGGDQNLPVFLGSNIVYPQKAKDANIEGRVVLTFTVEEDGTVDDVEVISSPSEDLSQEAIRVMLAMPKWKPAEQNKIKVAVSFTIPISFKLSGKTTN